MMTKRRKPIPRWVIHAFGIANAWYMVANFYRGWHGHNGWYFLAAMSFCGVLISAHTLRITEK